MAEQFRKVGIIGLIFLFPGGQFILHREPHFGKDETQRLAHTHANADGCGSHAQILCKARACVVGAIDLGIHVRFRRIVGIHHALFLVFGQFGMGVNIVGDTLVSH